jgi:hypothetical protein
MVFVVSITVLSFKENYIVFMLSNIVISNVPQGLQYVIAKWLEREFKIFGLKFELV